jgi:hypothetical protein
LELEPYTFVVGAADANQMVQLGEEVLQLVDQLVSVRPDRPPISIQYHLVGRPVVQYMGAILTFPPQPAVSLAVTTLRDAGRPNPT